MKIRGKPFQKGCISLMKGKHHTKEAKEKISLSHMGKKLSEETKKKLSLKHKGKIHSVEHNKKVSLSHIGLPSPMLGKHHTEKTKRKMSLSAKGNQHWLNKHHTEETKKKLSENRKGEKCYWLWKGGITNKNNLIRKSIEYIIWQKEVYKKDWWTCRICGSKKDIVAHHLKLFSEFPELRFSVDNGITLCRSCHLKLHRTAKLLKTKDMILNGKKT